MWETFITTATFRSIRAGRYQHRSDAELAARVLAQIFTGTWVRVVWGEADE